MAIIIPFRPPAPAQSEDDEIDLMTAVDAAIRDLADVMAYWGSDAAWEQAEECRRMLIRAYRHARLAEGDSA